MLRSWGRISLVATAVAVAGLPLTSPLANAALEEIVVTAQRREQTLQDVPIAVTAIGTEAIEARGIKDFSTYLTTVPSASLYEIASLGNEVKIRGIGSGTAQLSPTTAVYLGEVPVIHTGRNVNSSYNFWLVDIERVEVLRGPQGQLFGSNSLGGAIRNIPKAPDLENFGLSGSASWSDTEEGGDNIDGDLTVNLPLIRDTLGLRVTAYGADLTGWYDNIKPTGLSLGFLANFAPPLPAPGGALPAATVVNTSPPGFPPNIVPGPPGILAQPGVDPNYASPAIIDEDVNDSQVAGIRAMLGWEISDRLSADFMLAYEDKETDGNAWAEDVPNVPNPFIPGTFLVPNTVNPIFSGVYLTPSDPKQFQQVEAAVSTTADEIILANLVIEYDFDFARFTSSTSWWERTEELNTDSSGIGTFATGVNDTVPFLVERTDEPQTFIQEFRLTSTSESRLQWLAGLFYQEIDQDFSLLGTDSSGSDVLYWNQFVRSLLPFPPTSTPTTRVVAKQDANYVDEQIAIFGELSYEIFDSLTAAFSFRWFTLDQEATTVNSGFSFLQEGTSRAENDDDVFTPKFNLSWTPSDDQLYYLTVANGYRTGILPRDLPTATCGLELAAAGFPNGLEPTKEDTTWNYELGSKLTFADRRLILNGAVYYIEWEDVQTQVFMPNFNPIDPAVSQCNSDAIINGGDAEVFGVELEFNALLTDSLRLDGSFSYTDAEWQETVSAFPANKGDTVENVPEWLTYLGLQWDFQLFGLNSFARADWNYVGEKEGKAGDFVNQVQNFEIGDYHTLGLRAGMSLTENLSAEIWAENLTDEFGVTWTLDTGGFSQPTVMTIRPRTVGATLRWSF